MKSGIYCIENIKTNDKYIGQAKDIKDRWSRHRCNLRKNVHSNIILQNSWNKYGEETFIFYIIEILQDREERNTREKYWISTLKTLSPFGMNIKEGGNCEPLSEMTKKKLSAINSGSNNPRYGIPRSEETKRKISEATKGKNLGKTAWNKGIPCSDETKKKLSDINRGRVDSEETRKKRSKAFLGKKHTDETKKRLSEINKGKTLSDETKRKISETKKRNKESGKI